MKPKVLKKVVDQIHRRFPEFTGSKPKVRVRNAPQEKSVRTAPTYLLTFHCKASTNGKKIIPRWVRVVVNEQGKILKITTSR